jgi:putative nucleotidyltransferase with HDIG domain
MMTTHEAEAWLRDLQGAVSNWRLYPPEHPRTRALIGRLLGHVDALTQTRSDYSVFIADDRLFTESGIVETAVPVARGVFASLQANGFDRLSVSRGVTEAELTRLVLQLAELEGGQSPRRTLEPTEHVRFSRMLRPGLPGAVGDIQAGSGDGMLERVWESVRTSAVETTLLDGLVLAIGQAIHATRGSWIPLAALRSHDAYTVTHITNVATLAMALADALGLNDRFVRDLGTAALLHDVGKLEVPAEILNCPTRLNDQQLALMRRHPEDGARILMAAPGVPDLAIIVAFEHHLHQNGGGYPTVPASWRIHLASTITHVADVYDALRSDRPYRKGLAAEVVAQMMLADAETVFDTAVLQVFLERVAPRLRWVDPSAPESRDEAAPAGA